MAAGAEPRFAVGDRVRILDLGKPGHVRTPSYVRGRVGTIDGTEVRVHDSNADLRYIVLPMRPAGTETLSEQQLADLVTRDCLVGTARPRTPGV
jgi:hypothetical protein